MQAIECLSCGEKLLLLEKWRICTCGQSGGRAGSGSPTIVGGNCIATVIIGENSKGQPIVGRFAREHAPSWLVWKDTSQAPRGRPHLHEGDHERMSASRAQQKEFYATVVEYAFTTRATLQSIGDHFGVSRERVRQILGEQNADDHWRALRKRVSIEREQERLWAKFAERAKKATACCVCGYWVLRTTPDNDGTRKTCSRRCAKIWGELRLILDDEDYEKHRRVIAERVIALEGAENNHPPSAVRHAKRILSGEAVTQFRYVKDGSKKDKLLKELGIPYPRASEVFANGLPWDPKTTKAQSHCGRGHEMAGDNLYISPSGSRTCKACMRIRAKERYYAMKAAEENV